MRWTLKLVAELEPGRVTEHEIASFERGDRITPANGRLLNTFRHLSEIRVWTWTALCARRG